MYSDFSETTQIVLTAQQTSDDLLEMSVFQNEQCEYLLNSVSPLKGYFSEKYQTSYTVQTYLCYRSRLQSFLADCLPSATIEGKSSVVVNVFMPVEFSSLVFWLRNI